MDARLSRLRRGALQGAARRALALPGVRLALAVGLGLMLFPWYLAYFSHVLTRAGALGFWMPVR